jgi:flagellar protein FliO/FliZ
MNKLLNILIVFLSLFSVSAFAESTSLKPASVEAFSMMGVLNMVMGLVVVIALILGLAWVLKKYAKLPGNNQVDMKVLGGLSLGTREKAILIEVENTRLLVGVTPGHIQTLHVLSGDIDVEKKTESFESKLETVMESQR